MLVTQTAFACAGERNQSSSESRGPVVDAGGVADVVAFDSAATSNVDGGGPEHRDGATGNTGERGLSGLEGLCEYYKVCGGSYYETAQDCMDASLSYWGECRRAELDAFGDCMVKEVSCEDWNPDAYDPAATPCSEEWSHINNRSCP